MEFLQTIWTALTTQNEELITLFSVPLTFIEITVTMLFFTTILNISAARDQKAIYVLSAATSVILINNFVPKPLCTYICMAIFFVLILLFFKTNILKTLIAIILTFMVTSVLEMFFLRIYLIFFKTSYINVTTIPIYRFSMAIFIYLVIFLLYKLISYFKFNITLIENMNLSNKIFLFLNFLLALISICAQFYLGTFYNDNLPFLIVLLSMISLIAYFFISIYSLTRTTKLEIATRDLESEKLYNKSLTILHDSIRCFRHDFSNMVSAIGGFISSNDMDGLKSYYSELLADCQTINNLSTLSPEVINNPAVYSLLTAKYHRADESGIKINLEIFLDLNTINMKIYEFTKILGILMDNAIEAASECDDKIVNLIMRNDRKHSRQLLIIENTYKDKNIDTEKIYEKSYSTKPNNTGLGLWEVRKILKKNRNLNLFTTKDDVLFKQQLEIYYN